MRVHLMGVGGVGMSGLARVLVAQGHDVSGCDRAGGAALDALAAAGVRTAIGHDAAHVAGVDRLVVTGAVPDDHPELAAARAGGVQVLHRADQLAELLAAHPRRVVVTGAHGKTTTSAMLAYAADRLGLDPTFLVGGDVRQLGANARAGASGLAIAEGDESDRSVARLPATVAIVLNVDLDHLDHYASVAEVEALLATWTVRLPADGALILGDGVELPAPCRVARFGVGPGEGLRALDVHEGADGVAFRTSDGHAVELAVPGAHNAGNACAAALALEALGVPRADALAALAGFAGAGRRFEPIGMRDGAQVVDDYAHHPVELAATLAAARARRPQRLVVYFQPHMPWRTRAFADAFAAALSTADVAIVQETYVARGAPDPDASARRIVDAVDPRVGAVFVEDEDAGVHALAAALRPGDLVLTCGAGPVDRVARRIVAGER